MVWLNSFCRLCPAAQYKAVLEFGRHNTVPAEDWRIRNVRARYRIQHSDHAFRAVITGFVLVFCDIFVCQQPPVYNTEFGVPVPPALFISVSHLPAFLKILQSASCQIKGKPCKVAYRGGTDGVDFHREALANCTAFPQNCQNVRSCVDLVPVCLLRVDIYIVFQRQIDYNIDKIPMSIQINEFYLKKMIKNT